MEHPAEFQEVIASLREALAEAPSFSVSMAQARIRLLELRSQCVKPPHLGHLMRTACNSIVAVARTRDKEIAIANAESDIQRLSAAIGQVGVKGQIGKC